MPKLHLSGYLIWQITSLYFYKGTTFRVPKKLLMSGQCELAGRMLFCIGKHLQYTCTIYMYNIHAYYVKFFIIMHRILLYGR